MAAALTQSAYNSVKKQGSGSSGSTSVKATFTTPTTPGAYILVILTTSGGVDLTHSIAGGGYSLLLDNSQGDLQQSIWGRVNAPATSSITGQADSYRGMTVRALELSGVAQASAVDKTASDTAYSRYPTTDSSGTTTRADEVVIAALANQYPSTSQSGFSGGFTKLYEDVSPDGGTQDWERHRNTVHMQVTTATGSYRLSGTLSSSRNWIGSLVTLKGGTTGPAKFTSLNQSTQYKIGGNTGSKLTVFGRLRSALQPTQAYIGASVRARIGPSSYQMRLGGWGGLLIGYATDYLIESVEGLEGWEVRTSDDDLPRGDGALRGVDLQAARQILIKLNWTGTRAEIETRAATLLRALVPQRDQDWELLYRLPGQPLKSVYCRPTNLIRGLDPVQVLLHSQAITLRAADPRHYAATISTLQVPISASQSSPTLVQANNVGTGLAYPIIRIDGAGAAASRMTLTNTTTAEKFDVAGVLPVGSSLVGDMQARVTGAPVSAVTIDGTSKYGAWQSPRTPFALAPGVNNLMFEVEPAGLATPTCSLEYRSTWSG